MQFPDAKIVIFAKAPVEGQVKTRLARSLGSQVACHAYLDLLNNTFDLIVHSNLANVYCYADEPDHAAFSKWKKQGVKFFQQSGNDLGQRMFHAFCQQLSGTSPVILLGTDCPVMSRQVISQALHALQSANDAVIVPTDDGGYVLLGFKNSVQAEIFENIQWSTEQVFDQTMAKLHGLGLVVKQMDSLWDVDTKADYDRWLKLSTG